MNKERRAAPAERGARVTLWGLLGLTICKGTVGWLTGSKALLADACHSAADCAGALISRLGRSMTSAPGMNARQTESAVSVILSAAILVIGLEMGISSVASAAAGPSKAPGWGSVAAIAAGMAVREVLIRMKRRRDLAAGLRTERAGEHRPDIFASLTALVGASAAMTGEALDMPFLYVLDPAAGLVISAFIVRMGCRLAVDAVRLTERPALDGVDVQMLLEAVQRVEGVVAVDDVRAREHGHYVAVDAVIRVNPRITVQEGQDVAQRVRRQLTKRFLHVADVSVNVLPYDPGYPYKSNHQDEEWSTLLQ